MNVVAREEEELRSIYRRRAFEYGVSRELIITVPRQTVRAKEEGFFSFSN